jgi:hypothetical protein
MSVQLTTGDEFINANFPATHKGPKLVEVKYYEGNTLADVEFAAEQKQKEGWTVLNIRPAPDGDAFLMQIVKLTKNEP